MLAKSLSFIKFVAKKALLVQKFLGGKKEKYGPAIIRKELFFAASLTRL